LSSERASLQSKVTELNKELTLDYGADREFRTLHNKCFSIQSNQYKYEFCFFGKATQTENGHSGGTSLGSFTGWSEPEQGSAGSSSTSSAAAFSRKMLFENGNTCWQGPARSLAVSFKCGLDTAVVSVDEVRRCVYAMVVETPAVCTEQLLERARSRLSGQEEGDD
jgi:protein kinase C substrate 80K-H